MDIPSYVYAELGVASVNHPTGGSFGVDIFVKNTFAGQVQVIPYHDRNPYRTHYDGLPHWNQEVRLVFPNGVEKLLQRENVKVVQHQIDDAPQITVNLFGIEDAPVSFIINRDDFRERDK